MQKFYSITLLIFLFISTGYTQITYLNTATVLGGGSSSQGITFNIATNRTIFIKDIKSMINTSGTVELWYNPIAINGKPTITTTTGWVSLGTISITSSGLQSLVPINLLIPAGSNYGFFISSTGTMFYSGSGSGSGTPTYSPTSFTDGVITMDLGTNIGYGGITHANHPRGFNGEIGYELAPTVPNDAGASDVYSKVNCPGLDTVFTKVANYGANQIDSIWINWKKNGTLQTPIHYVGVLDTFGGTGPNSFIASLGVHTFSAGNTESFEVWTSMPNGIVDTSNNNDTINIGIKPSLTGVFTIGGASPDYANFAAASADLSTIGLCGPITFNVRSGIYTEQFELNPVGTSSVNTITFQNDPANTSVPIIQYTASGTADNYIVKLDSSADYITFDSLNFKANGTTYGIIFNGTGGAEHLTIKNCILDGNTYHSTSNISSVIYFYGVGFDNLLIENNTINNGTHGIYVKGVSNSLRNNNITIRNNKINGFYFTGSYFYFNTNIVFENNELEQNITSTIPSYGLRANHSYGTVKYNSNNIILHGSGTNYALAIADNYGSASIPVEIYNNMLVTSPNNTGASFALFLQLGKYINVYHNTSHCRGGSSTVGYAGYIFGITSTTYGDIDIRNNIFVNSGGGRAFYINTASITGFFNHLNNNIYYSSGPDLMSLNGISNTLANWQTTTSFDTNSYEGDPGFISATNLHLQGTLAIDSGANLGVMIDIDGDTRPLTSSIGYDIGADEYTPSSCPVGYGVSSFGLTAYAADITWIMGASDTGWLLEYGLTGFTPGTGTPHHSSNDTTNISGLTPATTYDVYVRGICGLGDTSIYYGPVTFNTKCVSSMSGIYTINNTIATGGTNFNSFTDALNALKSCGILAPTTFYVKQGVYNEQVELVPIIGTSATNTITFKANPSNTTAAILTFTTTSTANYVLRFNGSEYITFDSLTINVTGTIYGRVIDFLKADYVTVKNCNINTTQTTSPNTAGIFNTSGVANMSNHCTIQNNNINGGYYGIYWYGGSSTVKENGNIIIGNKIDDFYYYGLSCYYQSSNLIEGNKLEQSNLGVTSYGLNIEHNDSVKVRKNKVILKGIGNNYGLYFMDCYGSASNPLEVSNNMIVTSTSSTGTTYGIHTGYGKHMNIYHNTVNVRGGSATGGRGIYLIGSNSTGYGNVNIRNNIFSNSGLGVAMYINTIALTSGLIDDMDNNIYHSAGINLISLNGISHTLPSYITASKMDSNSLQGPPGFITGTDLHLIGSIAYDNGDTTVGILTDIDGDVRPLAPSIGWDIGADEYIPPSCPSPNSMVTTIITKTSTTISWTNGPSDNSWQLQYGPSGFMLGTGTTINTSANPANISGLIHSTCYEVWLRSVCSIGDTSVWIGPLKFCTKCAPVSTYCTDFESDPTGVGTTPFCWETYVNTTGNNAIRVNTNTTYSHSGSNHVYFYGGSDASAKMMLIAPQVNNLNAGTHRVNVWLRGDTSVFVGTMTDPTNPATFHHWDTLDMNSTNQKNFKIDFRNYTGSDTYICFLFSQHKTYDHVYLDDYCWEAVPSCEKVSSPTVLNSGIDSNSLKLGWNLDTTQSSYLIAYGPTRYNPVINTAGGDTTNSTINFKNILGLQPLTEYCFWIKGICKNGDTSEWTGPICGKNRMCFI